MEDLILRYLDGECTVEEIEQVEQLLVDDKEFADLFLTLDQANQMFMNSPILDAPKGFSDRLMQKINPQLLPFHDGIVSKILAILIVSVLAIYSLTKSSYLNKGLLTEFSNAIDTKTLVAVCSMALFFIIIDFILNRSQQKIS